MKHLLLYAPLATLVVSGVLISRQRQEIAMEESRTPLLQHDLQAARSEERSKEEARRSAVISPLSKDVTSPIDLKALLAARDSQGDVNTAAATRAQARFRAMSLDELLSQLDAIKGLDISNADKRSLEILVMIPLTEKDPAVAIASLSHRAGDPSMGGLFGVAMKQWLDKDSPAAIHWLDSKIGAGTYDTKTLDEENRNLTILERTVAEKLVESEPKTIGARLINLPEKQRFFILDSLLDKVKPGAEAAIGDCIRTSYPESESTPALARLAGRLGLESLDRVDSLLAHISPTPAERTAVATKALQDQILNPNGIDLDVARLEKARSWGATVIPQDLERITGWALGRESMYQGAFEENAVRITGYQKQSGSDDGLAAFLESPGAKCNAALALPLAAHLSDPVKRQEIQQTLSEIIKSQGH